MVGDGPARAALARKYPQAVFFGARQGEQLAEAYAGSDVFVFPSRTDTFGLVLLEALASGLPGFIRKAELSRDRAEQRADRFAVGEKIDAKITGIERGRKATLSVKAREIEEDKQAMAEFGSSDSGASLGDILGAALRKGGDKDDKDDA